LAYHDDLTATWYQESGISLSLPNAGERNNSPWFSFSPRHFVSIKSAFLFAIGALYDFPED
jgi:hypothetical protein